jgi:hypothetical protein
MANEDTVLRPKDVDIPTANLLRSVIDRYASRVREDQRGQLTGTLHNVADVFDRAVKAADKKLKAQQWTAAGRELLMHEARAEAGAMIALIADAATKHHRDHLAALDAELSEVPTINEFRATEIRGLLRDMRKEDRDHFVSQSNDPEVLAAIVHGPASFPLVSDNAVKQALANYNRAHRASKAALRDDAATYVDVVTNFADDAQRHLADALR